MARSSPWHPCLSMAAVSCVALAVFSSRDAAAYSFGAPVCEVQSLPLVSMSPTLSSPPPSGWQLHIPARRYIPGKPMRVEVTNTDPTKRARGVLVWAKSGPDTGVGTFTGNEELFRTIPVGLADCDEWAISHTSSVAKTLDELHFDWTAPANSTAGVLFRAFVIEHCSDSNGCRSYQALTPVVVKQAGLFVDEFEAGG